MLNRDDLVAVCPPPRAGTVKRGVWDGYVNALTSPDGARLLKSYGIDTPLRLVHLLATFAAETGLTVLWESGAYDADGIVRVFGAGHHSARVTAAEARKIAALPVEERTRELFERVYGAGNPGKARDLGNTQPGDGWRFRGLGLNQMTGRAAHEAAAREIGVRVDDLGRPVNCIHMALIEWDEKDCNRWADDDDAVSIRKLINGGSLKVSVSKINGLPEALAAVKRAKRVITANDFETPPAGSAVAGNDRPASLASSTEVQMAGATGTGGAIGLYDATADAVTKTLQSGAWDWASFAAHLLASTSFKVAVLAMLAGAYWFAKRRYNYHVRGI